MVIIIVVIIQNAKCGLKTTESADSVVFLFRGGIFDRRGYILTQLEGERMKEYYNYSIRSKYDRSARPPTWAYREVELPSGEVDIIMKNTCTGRKYSVMYGPFEDTIQSYARARAPDSVKVQQSFICPWTIQDYVDLPHEQVYMFERVG